MPRDFDSGRNDHGAERPQVTRYVERETELVASKA